MGVVDMCQRVRSEGEASAAASGSLSHAHQLPARHASTLCASHVQQTEQQLSAVTPAHPHTCASFCTSISRVLSWPTRSSSCCVPAGGEAEPETESGQHTHTHTQTDNRV